MTRAHTHAQFPVEAEKVKLYRQIPAKQLCTRNEFSHNAVRYRLANKTGSKLLELLDSWQPKKKSRSRVLPPKRTAWNQPKAGWTGTYVQSTLTHIIHTWLQTVWTLANDVVVNVRWCCFFLRASEPSSCTAQHKALCTVITTAKEINDFVCNFLCFYSNVIALLFSYPFPPFIWQLLQGMCSDDPCSHASSTVLVPWCSVTSEMGGLCLITFPSCQSLTARVPWSLNV